MNKFSTIPKSRDAQQSGGRSPARSRRGLSHKRQMETYRWIVFPSELLNGGGACREPVLSTRGRAHYPDRRPSLTANP